MCTQSSGPSCWRSPLSAAGGVVGGRGRRCSPPAAAQATALAPAPASGGDDSWGLGGTAAPDAAAARAAEAGVPRAKACGGPEQDMTTAWSTPRIGAAGSTAGKEGAGVAT